MRIEKGNIWTYTPYDYRVITTNGFVKKDGQCVMGRGVALEAKQKYPTLPFQLGQLIKDKGNQVHVFPDIKLITFPTKHSWWEKSDIELIRQSALQIQSLKIPLIEEIILCPKFGCGNGKLEWKDVNEVVSKILDDRFIILE